MTMINVMKETLATDTMLFQVKDKPEDHKYISPRERDYIVSERKLDLRLVERKSDNIWNELRKLPWKSVLTSLPVNRVHRV